MDTRGFEEGSDLRSWIGRKLGEGEGYSAYLRRRRLKQWGVAAAVLALVVVFAAAGWAIGSSQVKDSEAIQDAAIAAGEQRGTEVGSKDGYDSAYEPAHEHAYDSAYRHAYLASYREEFDKADLAAPDNIPVKVSAP